MVHRRWMHLNCEWAEGFGVRVHRRGDGADGGVYGIHAVMRFWVVLGFLEAGVGSVFLFRLLSGLVVCLTSAFVRADMTLWIP